MTTILTDDPTARGKIRAHFNGVIPLSGLTYAGTDDKEEAALRLFVIEQGWRLGDDAIVVSLLLPGETRPYPSVDFTRELTVRLQAIDGSWYMPGQYRPVDGKLTPDADALPVIRETVTLVADSGMFLETTLIEWLGADGSTHYSKTREKWVAA